MCVIGCDKFPPTCSLGNLRGRKHKQSHSRNTRTTISVSLSTQTVQVHIRRYREESQLEEIIVFIDTANLELKVNTSLAKCLRLLDNQLF